MNLSKQTFKQWLASHDFRRAVAVQVASGLIIAAIVAVAGLGFHEIRSDAPPRAAATPVREQAPPVHRASVEPIPTHTNAAAQAPPKQTKVVAAASDDVRHAMSQFARGVMLWALYAALVVLLFATAARFFVPIVRGW